MSRSGDEKVSLVDLGRERPQVPATARNMSPIVPRASISGRALVAVVAIMTFLASLTTGTVLLVSASAAEWQSEVSSEITIQVRPSPGRDLDRDAQAASDAMRAQSGILEVRPFSKEESAKLLEPWLGSGLSIDELPVPRVIVARVQPGTTLDLASLRARVTQVAPTASVDDHRAWIERMRSMTGATVFAGVGILILVIVATIISVSFATRGAMAANRPIVEVLHFVGAGDSFIANRFLRHFLRLGLEGGLIGGGAAMLAFGAIVGLGALSLLTDWHANSFAGSTVRKITRGMWALDLLNDTILMALLPSLIVLVGSMILLGMHWPQLGAVIAVGSVIYVAMTMLFQVYYVAPAARVSNAWDTKVGGTLADALTCNAVVKSFGAEAREDGRLDGVISRWRRRVRRTWFRYNHTSTAQLVVLLCFRASVIGGAILLWAQGHATPGDVTYVLTSYYIIHAYLRDVGMHINNLQRSVNDMEELVQIHGEPLGIVDADDAGTIDIQGGRIVFDDVTFHYGGHRRPLYDGLSVDIDEIGRASCRERV